MGWGVHLAWPEQGSLVGMHARGIKVRRNKRMFDDIRKGGTRGTDAAAADGRREERKRGGEVAA